MPLRWIHRKNSLLFPLLGAVIFQGLSLEATAQTPSPPAFLKQTYHKDFRDTGLPAILANLQSVLKINSIMDGIPTHKASIELKGTVSEVFDQLCAEYDSTWKIGPSGIVLFTRKFRKPSEFPQIHLPEMLQMTKQINQALKLAQIDLTPGHEYDALGAFAASLTPDQMRTLESGERLGYSAFSEEQRNLMSSGLAAGTFAPMSQVWQKTEMLLRALPASTLQARRQNTGKTPVSQDYQVIHVAKPKGEPTLITILQEYGFFYSE